MSKVEEIYKIGDTSRVKFVELSGVRYKDFYKSSDPYTRNCFPEDDCFLCKDQRSTAPPFRSQGQEQSSTPKTLDEENQTSTAPPMIKPTHCKTSSVGYSIACKLCKQRNRDVTYEGETARNAYIRGKEHLREYRKESHRSVLHKHVLTEHVNEKNDVEFEMKVVGKFKNPLSRQIDESIRIRNKKPNCLLNSKSEFHGPIIKRKILEKYNNNETFGVFKD